jgi:uncharacterized protein YjbI with pentapeptide repeats
MGANLKGANLKGAVVTPIDLIDKAGQRTGRLRATNLRRADLSEATLEGVDLGRCLLDPPAAQLGARPPGS